jgi:hypothetical protein
MEPFNISNYEGIETNLSQFLHCTRFISLYASHIFPAEHVLNAWATPAT